MKQNRWEERLEQHLADYRKEPSRDLWAGIEEALDKEVRPQARIVMLRRWMVAAAIVGVLAGGTWLYFRQEQSSVTSHQPDQTEALTQVKGTKDIPVVDSIPESLAQTERVITPVAQQSTETALYAESPHTEKSYEGKDTETKQSEPDLTPEASSPDPSVIPDSYEYPLPRAFGRATRNHRSHLLAMNVFASGGMSSWENRNGVLMSPSMLQGFAMSRGRNSDSPVYLVGYEERQSHNQPISFGLSFSYPLTDRLAIGTGIVYTKLYSEFLSIIQDYQICRQQTLHYVGIPLNIQYTLWQWRGLNVYLSAGGQVDWNVEAKSNTDGIELVMSKDRIQWSVGGSLGVEYDILPHFGLYAEPGIRHYFDNGSNVTNIFKDIPTDFHLELGLRFK